MKEVKKVCWLSAMYLVYSGLEVKCRCGLTVDNVECCEVLIVDNLDNCEMFDEEFNGDK